MRGLVDALLLVLFSIPLIILVVRFMYWRVDRDLKDLERLETDPVYRSGILAELDTAIAAKPDDPGLRRRRADLRRLENDRAVVVEDLEVYLRHRPRDDAGWQELAEALLAQGKPTQALAAINRAQELDPEYTDYQILRAEAALASGNRQLARDCLRRAEALEHAAVTRDGRRRRPRSVAGMPVPARRIDERIAALRARLDNPRPDSPARSAPADSGREQV